jgi:anti-sigma B factor antagonist
VIVAADLPPAFEVEWAPLSGAPGVVVRGEVDIGTVAKLSEALDEAVRESAGALVVDLREVVFLGSSGLTALVRARAQLGREERALVLVCPPGPVRRLFEVVGIVDLFELFDSREEAAASLLRPD